MRNNIFIAYWSFTKLVNFIGAVKQGFLKKENNIFLANLIFVDLLFTLCSFPLLGFNQILNEFAKNNQLFVDIWGFLYQFGVWTSAIFMCLVGYNRYLFMCNSDLYQKLFTTSRQYIFSFFVWTFVFIASILPIVPTDGLFNKFIYSPEFKVFCWKYVV